MKTRIANLIDVLLYAFALLVMLADASGKPRPTEPPPPYLKLTIVKNVNGSCGWKCLEAMLRYDGHMKEADECSRMMRDSSAYAEWLFCKERGVPSKYSYHDSDEKDRDRLIIAALKDSRPVMVDLSTADPEIAHGVVVVGYDGYHAWLLDPNRPKEVRKITRQQFLGEWSYSLFMLEAKK